MKKFEETSLAEKHKYKDKVLREVTEGKRGSSYAGIKKLSLAPGENIETGFQLPHHLEEGLSSQQSVERIAEFFAHVSQEYSPLNVKELPPNVQLHLEQDCVVRPNLSIHEVYTRIIRAKKPKGITPGDLPSKLTKSFPEHLALPASVIFNSITHSRLYPSQWKVENQIPIPKVHPPESEDDLRNISKTPFLNKVY